MGGARAGGGGGGCYWGGCRARVAAAAAALSPPPNTCFCSRRPSSPIKTTNKTKHNTRTHAQKKHNNQGKTALTSVTGRAANNVPLSIAIGGLDMTGQASALYVKAPGGYWKLKLELAIKDGLAVLLTGCSSGLSKLATTWPLATVLDCSTPLTITYTEPFILRRLGLKTVVKFPSRAVYEAKMPEATIFVA